VFGRSGLPDKKYPEAVRRAGSNGLRCQVVFVYVLRSLKDGKRYIGLSENVDERREQHNRGQVDSTKGRRPFKFMYKEELNSLADARKREKYFKSAAGRRFLKRLGL